jgi:hypothetical protein
MKRGKNPEIDAMLAVKVLADATLKAHQAGKVQMEFTDEAIADGRPVTIKVTVEVIDA